MTINLQRVREQFQMQNGSPVIQSDKKKLICRCPWKKISPKKNFRVRWNI